MNSSLLLEPILAGLSVGVFCVAYCAPFLAPFVVAESRNLSESFWVVLKFLLGRLIGYVFFGALFGFLGERFQSDAVDLIASISLVILSLILLLYLINLMKPKGLFCSAKFYGAKSPIVMGFLLGVNVCPPFLVSLAYVFSLHSMLKGVLYFLLFFLATSVFLLPFAFAGLLSRMKEFQQAARYSGLIVGILFLIYGINAVIKNIALLQR